MENTKQSQYEADDYMKNILIKFIEIVIICIFLVNMVNIVDFVKGCLYLAVIYLKN